MSKWATVLMAFVLSGFIASGLRADMTGSQPETPAGMNQAPVAGSPVVDSKGVPKLVVEFETGHSDIPPSFSRIIDAFGKYLKNNPQSKAEIIAYSDHTGHGSANVVLAQKRADAVENYVVANYGISADRIKASGYGEVTDKIHNSTEAGKQANRRAYGSIVNPKP